MHAARNTDSSGETHKGDHPMKSINKLLGAALACAAVMTGCGDDAEEPASAQTPKVEQQAAQPSTPSAAPAAEETKKKNSETELSVLVEDADTELSIYVEDTFGKMYSYDVCIGERCNKIHRDSNNSNQFKFVCDKLNSKKPCSSVYTVRACHDETKVCKEKVIDFAGPLRAKKIVVGYEHACAIRLNNTVACWGRLRGYADNDGSNSAQGRLATDVVLSKSQDVTCIIDPEHNFNCYGADSKRFKPIESLVRSASVSINSICYVTLDGKAHCQDAEDEENGYVAYTNPDGTDITKLSDIKSIETDEFFTVALDYKGKLHFLGLNLDIPRFTELRESLASVDDISGVKDFSMGNDAICVVAGDEREVSCYGPKKSFDYSIADIIGTLDASKVSVGSQSACIIYKSADGLRRVQCGGIPFYYQGLKNDEEALDVSQGNSQVCTIGGDHLVTCYGNDYHRNGINFVPVDSEVEYEVNGVVRAFIPKDLNPKIEGADCRMNFKRHEIICRIPKLDFLPKDLRLKALFEINSLDGTLEVDGKPYENGVNKIEIKPEQTVKVVTKSGKDVSYKLKLLQTMKINKVYDLNKIWSQADGTIPDDFSCVWNFSDGYTDEGSCEMPMEHVFETDFAQSRHDMWARVDAYRKDFSNDGFEVKHFQPKANE